MFLPVIEEDDLPFRIVRVGITAGSPAPKPIAEVCRGPDLAPVVMAKGAIVLAPSSFLSTLCAITVAVGWSSPSLTIRKGRSSSLTTGTPTGTSGTTITVTVAGPH